MLKSDIELPSDKTFGFFFSGVFFLLAMYFAFSGVYVWLLIFSSLSTFFLISALLKPNILHFLNMSWMRLGLLLAMVVSPFVLGLLFFGIFTPVSILTRLFNRDELDLKSLKKSSYWKKKTLSNKTQNFKQQF